MFEPFTRSRSGSTSTQRVYYDQEEARRREEGVEEGDLYRQPHSTTQESNIRGGFRGSGLWPITPIAISFRFAKLRKALGDDAVKELQTNLTGAREDELVAQMLNADEQLAVHETPIEVALDVEAVLNLQTTPGIDSLFRPISPPPTQARHCLDTFRLHHPKFTPKSKRQQDKEIMIYDGDENTPETPIQDSPSSAVTAEPRQVKRTRKAIVASTPSPSTAARSITPLQPLPNGRGQPQLGLSQSSSLSQECVFPVPTNTQVTTDYASQLSTQWQYSPMMPPQVPSHTSYRQMVPASPSWDCAVDENDWDLLGLPYN
ncbi:hypothetical protein EDD36DRAFT_418206 [Exophiala viscosa]|uniref:Uncharacterized protein n=1 Tax=Exophiala viscosa TaxID=2486360 RepID=A0AAN6DY55_9EURO|nr:hypothetical protein EDD36DRAFT_418206 [Exophiala viscosa]